MQIRIWSLDIFSVEIPKSGNGLKIDLKAHLGFERALYAFDNGTFNIYQCWNLCWLSKKYFMKRTNWNTRQWQTCQKPAKTFSPAWILEIILWERLCMRYSTHVIITICDFCVANYTEYHNDYNKYRGDC